MTPCDRERRQRSLLLDGGRHEVADLHDYVNHRAEKDQTVLSQKILSAAECLMFRADMDPFYKHSFLTVLEAVRLHRKIFGEIPQPTIRNAVADCLWTYEHVRNWVLTEAQTERHDIETPECPSIDHFKRMTRRERLSLQLSIAKKTYGDMCEIYRYVLDSIPEDACMVFNVGDGTPLTHSFLSQMVPVLKQRRETVHVVSVDVRPTIYDLQRESVGEHAQSNVTLAFHCMDARKTIFARNVFDCTVASFMIDDCDDHPALFRELGRVTKPHGLICVSGHHLDEKNPLDDLVHNFGDLHHISGHPATFSSACEDARKAGLHTKMSKQTPHAWALVLSGAP
ncbi:MAG: class I SAM-dependent methyltransferase [Desulfomonilaceae bacterium]|nr:class I SAM-dependent methyltransferase [Desulfomonilaceae bacterium]